MKSLIMTSTTKLQRTAGNVARLLGVMGVVYLLSACAHSPQQMQLQIQLAVEPRNFGMQRAVVITAQDRRPSNIIGSRGGVYAQSSVITIRNSVEYELARAVSEGFTKWGFVSTGQVGATDPIKVQVVLEELRYHPSGSLYTKPVALSAAVSVKVEQGNSQYVSRYKSSSERHFLLIPNNRDNQDLINRLLQDTLSRLFQDRKFIEFLSS